MNNKNVEYKDAVEQISAIISDAYPDGVSLTAIASIGSLWRQNNGMSKRCLADLLKSNAFREFLEAYTDMSGAIKPYRVSTRTEGRHTVADGVVASYVAGLYIPYFAVYALNAASIPGSKNGIEKQGPFSGVKAEIIRKGIVDKVNNRTAIEVAENYERILRNRVMGNGSCPWDNASNEALEIVAKLEKEILKLLKRPECKAYEDTRFIGEMIRREFQ